MSGSTTNLAGLEYKAADLRPHGAEIVLVGQLLDYFGWQAINEVIFPTIFIGCALLENARQNKYSLERAPPLTGPKS